MDDAPAPEGLAWEGLPADPATQRWLMEHLQAAVACLDAPIAAVTVRGVDDAEMARLHQRFSGIDGTTDVLTFDHADLPSGEGPLAGDIAVCVDVAERAARTRSHTPQVELLLYAIHGLLHLMGEDDRTPEAYRRMHAREDAVLRAIGVGAAFHAP